MLLHLHIKLLPVRHHFNLKLKIWTCYEYNLLYKKIILFCNTYKRTRQLLLLRFVYCFRNLKIIFFLITQTTKNIGIWFPKSQKKIITTGLENYFLFLNKTRQLELQDIAFKNLWQIIPEIIKPTITGYVLNINITNLVLIWEVSILSVQRIRDWLQFTMNLSMWVSTEFPLKTLCDRLSY